MQLEEGRGMIEDRGEIKGFTLMELMVVVIIIGIIAAFAIPNYSKSVQKAHERDMLTQLTSIHASNLLYRSYDGKYWDTGGTLQNDLAVINSTLSINIIANGGTTYTYNSADGSSYTATASWDAYTLKVTEAAIDAANPCCDIGVCLAVAACP